jgi:excisionase family DNA binding protein
MTTNIEKQKLLYSHKEAAALLGIGVSTLCKLVQRGELQPKRIGDRILYPRCELVRFAYADTVAA